MGREHEEREHEPKTAQATTDHDDVATDEAHEGTAAETTWAKSRRAAVHKTRTHVHAQQIALNTETRMVLGTLRASRDIFDDFEKRYAKAKTRFEGHIENYLEAAKQRREDVNTILELLLGLAPETALVSMIGHAHEIADTVGKVISLTHPKPIGVDGKPASGEAKPIASDRTRLNWRPLVDRAIGGFDAFLTTTEGLATLDATCDGMIDELTAAVEGGPAAADLDARSHGLVDVWIPGTTGAYPDAIRFLLDVARKLDAPTELDIERRLAEQWIAELARDQVTDAITDVQPYLEKIGAIGPRSRKGLGIDPHGDELIDATTDTEQLMIWVRAQVKVEAEAAVGRSVRWMGGISNGDTVTGSVVLDGNYVRAVGRAESRDGTCVDKAVPTDSGGRVTVVEARWLDNPIEVTSNWHGKGIKDYLAEMRLSQVELVVEGTSSTGTELVEDHDDGPAMSAGELPEQD